MRNNPKVRAIRQKHGPEGYAVWCMLIETLTDCDNFVLAVDDITIEVLSGDFGVQQDVLISLLDSFRRLKLIQYNERELFAPGLLERMEPLISDRERKREWAAKKTNSEGAENQQDKTFSTSKTPQSKVKESKVNNTLKSIGKEGEETSPQSKANKVENYLLPDGLNTEKFKAAFSTLLQMPKWKKKPQDAVQMALKRVSKYEVDFAIHLIESTIEGNYQGLVFNDTDIKYQKWKTSTTAGTSKQTNNGKFTFDLNKSLSEADEWLAKHNREMAAERAMRGQ